MRICIQAVQNYCSAIFCTFRRPSASHQWSWKTLLAVNKAVNKPNTEKSCPIFRWYISNKKTETVSVKYRFSNETDNFGAINITGKTQTCISKKNKSMLLKFSRSVLICLSTSLASSANQILQCCSAVFKPLMLDLVDENCLGRKKCLGAWPDQELFLEMHWQRSLWQVALKQCSLSSEEETI